MVVGSPLFMKVGGAYVIIHGFSWKGLNMTVFESLTIMIAFAALIVAIMNSKNDKK